MVKAAALHTAAFLHESHHGLHDLYWPLLRPGCSETMWIQAAVQYIGTLSLILAR